MPMKSILLKLFEKNAALLFVNTKVLTSQNHRYHLGRLFLRERFSNLLFRTCSSLMYSKVMYPREGGEKHAHTNGKCNYLNKRHGVLNTKKKRRVDQSRPLVKQHNTISTLAATLTVIFLNYWCITNKFFFLQLMHMDVKSRWVLLQPLVKHGITTNRAILPTAAPPATVLHSTRCTYCLCTRLLTGFL